MRYDVSKVSYRGCINRAANCYTLVAGAALKSIRRASFLCATSSVFHVGEP